MKPVFVRRSPESARFAEARYRWWRRISDWSSSAAAVCTVAAIYAFFVIIGLAGNNDALPAVIALIGSLFAAIVGFCVGIYARLKGLEYFTVKKIVTKDCEITDFELVDLYVNCIIAARFEPVKIMLQARKLWRLVKPDGSNDYLRLMRKSRTLDVGTRMTVAELREVCLQVLVIMRRDQQMSRLGFSYDEATRILDTHKL